MMESELVLAEQRALDCSSANSRFKQEMANMSASHQTDIRSERQVKHDLKQFTASAAALYHVGCT